MRKGIAIAFLLFAWSSAFSQIAFDHRVISCAMGKDCTDGIVKAGPPSDIDLKDVDFNGVDLNPALLGCVLSGGDCLAHTGIDLLDKLFGGVGITQDHHKSYAYRKFYYNTMLYWDQFGQRDCRQVKEDFYIAKTGWKNEHPSENYWVMRDRYLQQYKWKMKNENIFECEGKHKRIFIEKKIGKE